MESAVDRLRDINPSIEVVGHDTLLFSENVFDIMEPYDVVSTARTTSRSATS